MKFIAVMAIAYISSMVTAPLHAQLSFRFVKATQQLIDINDAIAVLAGANVDFETTSTAPLFDLVDADSFFAGRFSYNLNLLGQPGIEESNFAIEVDASVLIPSAGIYTFGMALDDGGRFQIDLGNGFVTVMERTTGGAIQEFYGEVEFVAAGKYPTKLIYWDGAGQANVEVFSAMGSFTQFDDSMRLLGDSANGGLSLSNPEARGDINCDGEINFSDIPPFIGLLQSQ